MVHALSQQEMTKGLPEDVRQVGDLHTQLLTEFHTVSGLKTGGREGRRGEGFLHSYPKETASLF